MRRLTNYLTVPCAAIALAVLTMSAPAADNGGKDGASATADSGNGAIGSSTSGHGASTGKSEALGDNPKGIVSNAPEVHLTPPLPPLHLTDAQRQKVRDAVAGLDTEVTFQLKGTKPHKDFAPKVGEKVPAGLPAHALPSSLTQQLPMLADYKYMKVKQQVLIVNPMSKQIVDMFPEAQG